MASEARGEEVYSFAHLTFQEYLAAAYLEYEHADSIDDLWAMIKDEGGRMKGEKLEGSGQGAVVGGTD